MTTSRPPQPPAPTSGSKSPSGKKNHTKRTFRTIKLSSTLKSVVGREFRRRGFAVTEVVSRWADIVGAEMNSYTRPEKLTFASGRGDGGTLVLKVASGHAPTVTHMAPFIIDKVNTHFGHACVAKIKVIQGVLPPLAAPKTPTLNADAAPQGIKTAVDHQVSHVQDDDLKATLTRLGRLVHMSRSEQIRKK